MSSPINKRANQSVHYYIRSLFEKYSKIQVIRLDLGYRKDVSDNISLTDIKKDVKHMLNNARSKPSLFGDKVGHVIKYEEGQDRGQHAHLLLLLNGHKVLNSAHRGDQILQYWQKDITNGKGTGHNCNREKYVRSGVGMIDHTDTEKRKCLTEDVLPYLVKTEQSIDASKVTGRERSFTRAIMPKPKSNIGRPRLTNQSEDDKDA